MKCETNLIGSGWAFAATGAIEAIHAITTGNLVSLSEQELIDCVDESEGCYNGWPYHSFEWVKKNGGIASEADYPYKAKDGRCKANKVYDPFLSLFLLPSFHNFALLYLYTH